MIYYLNGGAREYMVSEAVRSDCSINENQRFIDNTMRVTIDSFIKACVVSQTYWSEHFDQLMI